MSQAGYRHFFVFACLVCRRQFFVVARRKSGFPAPFCYCCGWYVRGAKQGKEILQVVHSIIRHYL